jgi:predicted porin
MKIRRTRVSIQRALATIVILGVCVAQANAQNDVIMYGRVVDGINYQSNQDTGRVDSNGKAIVGSSWGINGNVWGTSIFGVKGTEDLDDGLKALFVLETGFNASTGRVNGGSALWSRRSLVGLSGDFGTLKLGRNLSLVGDVSGDLDSGDQQTMGTPTLVKGRNWPIYNNEIDYATPNMDGFSIRAVYGMGDNPGSTTKGSNSGISLAYGQSDYQLRAMYDVANDVNGQYSSLFQYSKELTVGGTLTLDKLKLFVGYQGLSAPGVFASQGNPDKAYQFWLGATYQVARSLTLIGGAYHVNLNQNSGSASLFTLGANYNLSKRTLLYANLGTVRNGAQTSFAVETGTSVTGQNQNAFYAGVSYRF